MNIAKGRVNEFCQGAPTDIKLLLLSAISVQATIEDFDTVAALLADPGTTEANFTGYTGTRPTLANVAVTTDDSGNSQFASADDIVIDPAGGATNDTVVAAIVYKEVTTDADSIPLTQSDLSFTTTGTALTIKFPVGGFFAAS